MVFQSIFWIGIYSKNNYKKYSRLLIIKTYKYSLSEIVQILAIRANTENIKLTEEALAHLGAVGV